MWNYYAAYKCPLCGAVCSFGEPKPVPYDKLPELCARVVKNQRLIGTTLYEAPMHIPHHCDDGSCGMAVFAGFKKIGG